MKAILRTLLVLVLALGSIAACGGARQRPEDVVRDLARALRERRYDDAYDLMSRGYRLRVTREDFRRAIERSPAEASELSAALERIETSAEITALVPHGADEPLRLIEEDGSWRVDDPVVDFYRQDSPRAALRSFVEALSRRRYDVVLRFVPNADREGMNAETIRRWMEGEEREDVERLMTNLRAHLDDPIEVVGDRATMHYAERFAVQFVREDGVWRIEDPD